MKVEEEYISQIMKVLQNHKNTIVLYKQLVRVLEAKIKNLQVLYESR
jgi:hypothetical protein